MNNKTTSTSQLPSSINELEIKLNEIFGIRAPQMPENVKEVIVKYGPYISVIIMIMALPVILGALGLGALMTPLAFLGGIRAGIGFSIGGLVSIISTVLSVIALPGLFKRQIGAWRLMFWSSLITAVGAVLRFDIGGLIIGTALSWYVLFQIRSYYK